MNMRWNRKDLLGLRELSADEINLVLETADAFKKVGTREIKKVPRFARENAGEFLYRTKHVYTHVIRAGGGSTERGCDQYHGLCLEPEQG